MLDVEELLELEDNIRKELDDHLPAALSMLNRTGELETFLKMLGMEDLLQSKPLYQVYKTGKIIVIGRSDVKAEVLLSIAKSLGLSKDRFELYLKIKLEYASLNETFRGAIVLDEKPTILTPTKGLAPKVPNKKTDTLQSIIDKVNERFNGNFTDSDRVIIEGIYQMFMKDSDVKKFKKYAKDNSTEMFVQSLFPDKFKDIVTQCFLDNNDSFSKLFNDPDFYNKVQEAMAAELYKALRKD